jgi:hypothetical protein
MAFWNFLLPAAAALIAKPKTPKPPAYEQQLGETAASIYNTYVPQVAEELKRLAGMSGAAPDLYTQRFLSLAPKIRYQGEQSIARNLAARGLFNVPNVQGALSAYNAYTTQALMQQLGQAVLQDESLRREALARLSALVTGTAQPALAVGQQMMTAASQAQAQEAALASALAPLFIDLFIKKKPTTTQATTLLPTDFLNLTLPLARVGW